MQASALVKKLKSKHVMMNREMSELNKKNERARKDCSDFLDQIAEMKDKDNQKIGIRLTLLNNFSENQGASSL